LSRPDLATEAAECITGNDARAVLGVFIIDIVIIIFICIRHHIHVYLQKRKKFTDTSCHTS